MSTTKHSTVLALYPNQVPGIGQVLFTQTETEPGIHPETYYFSETLWEDMGEPTVITVTTEPGDLLNVDESDTPIPEVEQEISRDATTGQFVSADYAEENPDTTVTESG